MTSIKLKAKKLNEQIEKTEDRLWRMRQNRAYESEAKKEELEELYEKIRNQKLIIPSLVEDIDNLEGIDPLHTIYKKEWMQVSIQVESILNKFAREVDEPLAELLQSVEGSAAKARWFSPEPSKWGIPPIAEVRERWATLVGISAYDIARTKLFKPLSTCKNDAQAMHELLLRDRRYGYQADKTQLLLDEQAQAADILRALKHDAEKADADDMLFFYFSGHGDLKEGNAVLIPYDYNPSSPMESAVRIAEVTEIMKSSQAKHKILILDACHSGPDIEVKGAEEEKGMDPEFEKRVFDQARGSAVLSSCVAKQSSYTYSKTHLSAFTYFLCEGLRGAADFGNKGFVTVSDTFHYVANTVQQWAEERYKKQTPALSYTTTGEIILMDYRQGRGA